MRESLSLPRRYFYRNNSLVSHKGVESMDFYYSPRLVELKERAANLASKIMLYEDECEANNGLSPEALTTIRQEVLASGLQAINMPIAWSGAGLTVLEQAVVQEELGKLTNALWDTVWRP